LPWAQTLVDARRKMANITAPILFIDTSLVEISRPIRFAIVVGNDYYPIPLSQPVKLFMLI
jgi:hypothetical protein